MLIARKKKDSLNSWNTRNVNDTSQKSSPSCLSKLTSTVLHTADVSILVACYVQKKKQKDTTSVKSASQPGEVNDTDHGNSAMF